eukprot:2199644-Pyramimonas_sp.AAC.1
MTQKRVNQRRIRIRGPYKAVAHENNSTSTKGSSDSITVNKQTLPYYSDQVECHLLLNRRGRVPLTLFELSARERERASERSVSAPLRAHAGAPV